MNTLRKEIQGIPTWVEFAAIITICFGHLIYQSSRAVFIDVTPFIDTITDRTAVMHGLFDLAVICITLGFLKLRGWKLSEFLPFKATWTGIPIAIILIASHRLATSMFYSLIIGIFGVQPGHGVLENTLSPIGVLAASLNIGLIEELIVLGYVTHVLQSRGPFYVITVSTFIRLTYHLYQGPTVLVVFIPMGVIFGLVYWKYRNLWPFVLAHMFYDMVVLA